MKKFIRFMLMMGVLLLAMWSTSPLSAQNADTKANKALLTRYAEVFFNQRKWDIGDEIFTQDIILHQPVSPDTVGLDAFKQGYQSMVSDWPDGKVTIQVAIAEGEYVAAAYLYEAMFSKPIAGPAGELKPTGKKVSLNATMLVRIRDGKIAEEWKMWDAWNVFQQLGAIPVQGDLPAITPWSIKLGTTTTSPQDFEGIVAAAFKVWPKSISVDTTAVDYAVHSPPSLGPDPQPGFAGYALWTKQFFSSFPNLTFTGPGGKGDYLMVAEGDLVAIQYTGQFQFTQDMPGLKANGATITAPGLSFLRIKDGQLTEFWVNIDTASMMMQMSAPPA